MQSKLYALLDPTFSAAKGTEANQQHAFGGRPSDACSATQRLRICRATTDQDFGAACAYRLGVADVRNECVHIVQASPH